MSVHNFSKIATITLIVTITANLIYLDIALFSKKSAVETKTIEKETKTIIEEQLKEESNEKKDLSCSDACISKIYEATSSGKNIPAQLKTQSSASVSQTSQVKEYFVPLGSGSYTGADWGDVAGVQAVIDSNRYGSIKSVVFEPSIHIPTGNETAYIRLFNATDKHPVWFSEVSLSGGTPQLLFSQPISFDSGVKTYQVQMKTSLNYPAVLDQARIHITTY